jgi:hypothetical protein
LKRLIADSVIVGGYNLGLFDKRPELKAIPAKLYYLRINDGEYYKIGITVKPVNDRIKGIKSKSKRLVHNVDVVWVIEASLYKCYLKEQELLTRYASVRCFTDWSNELFSENVLPLKLSSIS